MSTTKGKIFDGVYSVSHSGMLSSHRILASAKSQEQVRHRVAVIAAHAVGLQHCDEPGCVMRHAEGHLRHLDESNGRSGSWTWT